MNKKPKEYIVYWISIYAGTHSWSSEKYRANVKTFNDLAKAETHRKNLCNLMTTGGVYQQRHIYHVSDVCQ